MSEDDTAIVFYSLAALKARLEVLQTFFTPANVFHTVAIKTAPHGVILRRIVDLGVGLEAASFEEVRMALSAGASPSWISYNSPVKTRSEIAQCVALGKGLRLNANSFDELLRIPKAHDLELGLRINPLIDPGSGALFNVSGSDSKFGVPIEQEEQIVEAVLRHGVGTLHVHVGSQTSDFPRVAQGISSVFALADRINALAKSTGKPVVHTINIGGGVPYSDTHEGTTANMKAYVSCLLEALQDKLQSYRIVTEFGQWVHGNNGVAFTRVEYCREQKGHHQAFVHLGADMFPREVYLPGDRLSFICLDKGGERLSGSTRTYDVAGPLCFQGDFLAHGVDLPALSEGDVLAIPNTGANTFGLWSRHCSRTVPAFYMDDGPGGIFRASERHLPTGSE